MILDPTELVRKRRQTIESIKLKLEDEAIHRRLIPRTLPNDKSIYQGL
jgi:hypothetical protein